MTKQVSVQTGLPESLPGINIESAIKCLGSVRLFKKILSEFKTLYSNTANEIDTALKEGDMELAQRLSHTLKGVAGLFFAKELVSSAKELENSIKNQKYDELEPLLTNFRFALDEIVESAKLVEQHVSESIVPEHAALTDSAEIETSQIGYRLIEFDKLLLKNNPKAEVYFDSIRSYLNKSGFQNEIKQIDDQFRKFDFKSARKILTKIAQTMQVQLGE